MKQTLNKKIAGIPLYVWIILILGAVGVGLYLRSRNQAADALSTLPSDESFPIPGTVGGGPGGGGIVGDGGGVPPQDNTAEILAAIQALGSTFAEAIQNIPIPAPVAPYPPMLGPYPGEPGAGSTAPGTSPAAPPATVVTPPPPAPAGPVPGASFTWVFAATSFRGESLPAKSVWYLNDKPLFLKHLGARGLTYAGWRANHPSAACRVFGDC